MSAALFFALGATLCFSGASLGFGHFARRLSPMWMNCFKATVATCGFAVAVLVLGLWRWPGLSAALMLASSGALGLAIGDWFLMRAFAEMGGGRTLVVFSFQPLVLGVGAWVLLGQALTGAQGFAILCLMGCLLVFSHESFRRAGHWGTRGLRDALLGLLFDAVGVLITRAAFDRAGADFPPLTANLIRAGGALLAFVVMSRYFPFHFRKGFLSLEMGARWRVFFTALFGTCVSLGLWLTAIQHGHLASISAVSGSGPVFATLLECLNERRWPGIHVFLALCLFAVGFYLLQQP